jgi:hypothetical protein
MLASITPLGERGRHGHWTITVTAFLVGALATAAALGAGLGLAGLVLVSGVPAWIRLTVLAGALLVAAGIDAASLAPTGTDGRPRAVPGPRRQVDERWLDRYRGWVYGVGYGAQLGAGLATVVSSAATYVALLGAFLTADPLQGALVLGVYGAIRGLTPLAAVGVRTPDQLLAFHAGLQRARGSAAVVATAVLAAAVVPAGVIAAGLS